MAKQWSLEDIFYAQYYPYVIYHHYLTTAIVYMPISCSILSTSSQDRRGIVYMLLNAYLMPHLCLPTDFQSHDWPMAADYSQESSVSLSSVSSSCSRVRLSMIEKGLTRYLPKSSYTDSILGDQSHFTLRTWTPPLYLLLSMIITVMMLLMILSWQMTGKG